MPRLVKVTKKTCREFEAECAKQIAVLEKSRATADEIMDFVVLERSLTISRFDPQLFEFILQESGGGENAINRASCAVMTYALLRTQWEKYRTKRGAGATPFPVVSPTALFHHRVPMHPKATHKQIESAHALRREKVEQQDPVVLDFIDRTSKRCRDPVSASRLAISVFTILNNQAMASTVFSRLEALHTAIYGPGKKAKPKKKVGGKKKVRSKRK